MPRWDATRLSTIGAFAACVLTGIALSALPHVLWWRDLGAPYWIADFDDVYYLSLGSQALRDHPTHLADPVLASGGFAPHRWLVYVPGVVVTRLLGGSPLAIGLAWRIWAGLSLALGWYFVIRPKFKGPWATAALTVFLLADTGLIDCRPVIEQVVRSVRLLADRPGTLFAAKPVVHPEWRLSTPGLTMAYLLLCVGLLSRARERPFPARLAAAGVGFGLLFFVYFYYWTAVGLGLIIAWALDAGHRRVYVHTAWIGGLVGLPAFVGDVLARQSHGSEWLLRTDKFLPIGRFSELLVPKGSLILLALSLCWIWRSRRDLVPVWSIAAAGFAWGNQTIATGLQIENFHWISYVGNPMLELALVLQLAGWLGPRLERARWARWLLGGAIVAHLAAGLWLRGLEARRTAESRLLLTAYRDYRDERFAPGCEALAPHALTAGDSLFVYLSTILEGQRPLDGVLVLLSPAVGNAEWDERWALNDYLLWGPDRSGFEARTRALFAVGVWGPWSREPAAREQRVADRIAFHDAIATDPAAALERYPVRYLALLPGRTPPDPDRLGWVRQPSRPGGRWVVWERRERGSVTSPAEGTPR